MKPCWIITLLALLLRVPASADPVLDAFVAKVAASCVSFDYSYRTLGNVPLTGGGKAQVQGDAFHLTGNGLEVWCDGTTRWSADPDSRELVIETVGEGRDYAGNPALLISFLEEAFTVASSGEETFAGKRLHAVKLLPKVSAGLEEVQLFFSAKGALQGARVRMPDGTVTEFTLSAFSFGEPVPPDVFMYDPSGLDDSWVISDFRY